MVDPQNGQYIDVWLFGFMGIIGRVGSGWSATFLGLREWWTCEVEQKESDPGCFHSWNILFFFFLSLFLFFFFFFFCQEAKKKYDKETEKYCGILEKHLNLSSKKKESQLQEVRDFTSILNKVF